MRLLKIMAVVALVPFFLVGLVFALTFVASLMRHLL